MTQDIFLARQPIFDRHERVWGYILRANADLNCVHDPRDENEAAPLQSHSYLGMVLEKLAAGRKIILNVSNGFLNDDSLRLPREMVVLEISRRVQVDKSLLATCRHLKEQGHLLVLSDLVRLTDTAHPLAEMVDILKVNYQQTSPAERSELSLSFPTLKLLAAGVETREEFREAVNLGFHYVHGSFFSQAEIISRSEVPRYKLNFMKLLNELARTTLDFQRLQNLLEGNPTLIHRLLKYINSAFFGLNYQVSSVHQALLLLGEQEIRKWAALAIIHHLGQDQPEELLRLSLLRAHFGEILAAKMGLGPQAPELFLVGLLSLMDVYLSRPLAEVVAGMPLAPLIKETLLGGATPYRLTFDLVLAHERADWEQVTALASRLGLSRGMVLATYLEAVEGVETAIQS